MAHWTMYNATAAINAVSNGAKMVPAVSGWRLGLLGGSRPPVRGGEAAEQGYGA